MRPIDSVSLPLFFAANGYMLLLFPRVLPLSNRQFSLLSFIPHALEWGQLSFVYVMFRPLDLGSDVPHPKRSLFIN
jgi:hypothetical protein